MLQPQQEINQQDYLNILTKSTMGVLKSNVGPKLTLLNFISLCNMLVSAQCWEAWPLKSKPRSPYVCSQCSRDKQTPKKFSVENSMIPSSVPPELQNLTQIEEMLLPLTFKHDA